MTDDALTMGDCAVAARRFSASRKRRAHRIVVFGSVIRGEAGPGSDLDLLVDFEPGVSLLDHVGLFQDLEELLGDMAAKRASMSAFGIASRLTGTSEGGPIRP